MRYTNEQEFTFSAAAESRAVCIKANGGSVQVYANDGVEWILTDTLTEDGCKEIFTKGLSMKFTPVGGASYWIQLSSGLLK